MKQFEIGEMVYEIIALGFKRIQSGEIAHGSIPAGYQNVIDKYEDKVNRISELVSEKVQERLWEEGTEIEEANRIMFDVIAETYIEIFTDNEIIEIYNWIK